MSEQEVNGPYPGASYIKTFDNVEKATASVAGVASGGTGTASASFSFDVTASTKVFVVPLGSSTAIPDGWTATVDTTNDGVDVTVKNDTSSSQDYDFQVIVAE